MILRIFSFLLLISSSTVFTSCNKKIVIHVQNHWPYCGGKLPDALEAKGRTENFIEHTFTLIEENQQHSITTDKSGIWKGRLNLKKEILIIDSDKSLSLEELKAKYPLTFQHDSKEGANYRYFTSAEWYDWRSSADYMSITEKKMNSDFPKKGLQDTLRITIPRSCFTGTNPIIQYVGPIPK